MEKLKVLPGFRDFYPQSMRIRNYLFDKWRETAIQYGFEEWDAPVLESLQLYTIKSGEEIVSQLYHFEDAGKRKVALRPEVTPSLARMLLNNRNVAKPIKWFSIPRCFRTERQQKGRLREFFQFNVDLLGVPEGLSDAQVISLACDCLFKLGLTSKDFVVRINHREVIFDLFNQLGISSDKIPQLTTIIDKSTRDPMETTFHRIEELKLETSAAKPLMEYLSLRTWEEAQIFFEELQVESINKMKNIMDCLSQFDLMEVIQWDPAIIRGLDYYTGCVYEIFQLGEKGINRAIAGGGRYDNLLALFGGDPIPACGFGMGDVVLEIILQEKNLLPEVKYSLDYYIIYMNANLLNHAIKTAKALRQQGYKVDIPLTHASLNKQMKKANQLNARYVIIIGDEEIQQGHYKVKNMENGEEGFIKFQEMLQGK